MSVPEGESGDAPVRWTLCCTSLGRRVLLSPLRQRAKSTSRSWEGCIDGYRGHDVEGGMSENTRQGTGRRKCQSTDSGNGHVMTVRDDFGKVLIVFRVEDNRR